MTVVFRSFACTLRPKDTFYPFISLRLDMSHLTNAFIGFLSPIELLFRLLCWAPPYSPTHISILANVFCFFCTLVHFLFTILAIFKFHLVYLPDDITNKIVIICIELTYTVIMIESLVKRNYYLRIVEHFLQFDHVFSSVCHEVNMLIIYDRWKYVYYQRVYARLFAYIVCLQIGVQCYFLWVGIPVGYFGWLLCTAKIGIYAKTIQIAFFMDMVYNRLEFVEHALLDGQAKRVSIMYSLLWEICKELNISISTTVIIFYLECVMDLVNVSHIMYWNIVMRYSVLEIIGVIFYSVTIFMPLWELIKACERCKEKV